MTYKFYKIKVGIIVRRALSHKT